MTFAASLPFDSTAQDKTVSSKGAEAQSFEDKPSGENSKTHNKTETQQAETEDESFDLDSFFKQGEENAKNGSSCTKPPEPIV